MRVQEYVSTAAMRMEAAERLAADNAATFASFTGRTSRKSGEIATSSVGFQHDEEVPFELHLLEVALGEVRGRLPPTSEKN